MSGEKCVTILSKPVDSLRSARYNTVLSKILTIPGRSFDENSFADSLRTHAHYRHRIAGRGGMNIGVIYAGLGGTEVGDAVAAALSGVVVVLLMAGGLMDLVCGLLACALPSVPAAAPPRSSSASSRPSPASAALALDFTATAAHARARLCRRSTSSACIVMKSSGGKAAEEAKEGRLRQMKKLFDEFKAFAPARQRDGHGHRRPDRQPPSPASSPPSPRLSSIPLISLVTGAASLHRSADVGAVREQLRRRGGQLLHHWR